MLGAIKSDNIPHMLNTLSPFEALLVIQFNVL